MSYYGNIDTPNWLAASIRRINTNHKLIRGRRRCGKTTSGCIWMSYNLLHRQNTVSWIIVPTLKSAENVFSQLKDVLRSGSEFIRYRRVSCFEISCQKTNSIICIILAKDLFDRFPVGRRNLDYVFFDDVEVYSRSENRAITRKFRQICGERGVRPQMMIAYTPMKNNDRTQALWDATANKQNWDRFDCQVGVNGEI